MLQIEGLLLLLDDPAVLGEYTLGEPYDERPEQVNEPRDRGLTYHHQTKGVIHSLFTIDGDVHIPKIESGLLAARGPEPEGLVGILRAYRHEVAPLALSGLVTAS